MNLESHIRQIIHQKGMISIFEYMNLCVSYYYSEQAIFGTEGDFITAPEISQMFGEIIGLYLAHQWMEMGKPAEFILAECGPGRGVLMADILRATKKIDGFQAAARIVLVENSEKLRAKQKKALDGYDVTWMETPAFKDLPLLLVANEFLDALPVRQYIFKNNLWHECCVTLNDDDNFVVTAGAAFPDLCVKMPDAKEGDIFEVSAVRENFVLNVAEQVSRHKGAALFIDYGHEISGVGDTMQAVHKHQYCSIFDHIGAADITSHVDFGAMKDHIVKKLDGQVHVRMSAQGTFLKSLGIGARAAMLKQYANNAQAGQIDAALKRLCDKDEMGDLFKVMEIICI